MVPRTVRPEPPFSASPSATMTPSRVDAALASEAAEPVDAEPQA